MADLEQLKQRIVEHVRGQRYQPVKPKVIFKKLEIADEDVDLFRKAVKQLVKAGDIAYAADHRVQRAGDPPKRKVKAPRETPVESVDDSTGTSEGDGDRPDETADSPDGDSTSESSAPRRSRDDKLRDKGLLVGTFRKAKGGGGFVRLDDRFRQGKAGEILIPSRNAGEAVSGDRVSVRLLKPSRKDPDRRGERNRVGRNGRSGSREGDENKDAGQIVRVLERSRSRFVGTYVDRGAFGTVLITGAEFPHPIVIRDPSAHNAVDQDQVAIEILRYPTSYDEGEGVIVEVLGARGMPGVDTLFVMRQYDLPQEFPEPVLEQARKQAEAYAALQLGERIPKGRTDLTGLLTFTVDPNDAKDFDDAVSLETLENGHRKLGVHIADVAYFVPIDTDLDREARDRATSVYLPDRVIPMLPEIISNHLASLQPDQPRLARTCFIEYTAEGQFVDAQVVSSVIRSKRRLTYEQVDQLFDDPKTTSVELTKELRAKILEMRDFAMLLRKRRRKAGAVELTSIEVKLELDKQSGKVLGAKREINTVSHQLIEEFMLAANQAVAFLLEDRGLPFLHRVHDPPPLDRIESLHQFLAELGIEVKNLEDRYSLQKLLETVKGAPYEQAVHFAVLRSMSKAVYSPDEAGHFALAFEEYGHFTSPIRRYPDLTIHRTFDAIQHDRRPPYDYRGLVSLGIHCSEREQRAERSERDLIQLKLLHFFEEHPDRVWPATVTGVEEFGVFAQCKEFPLEGLLPRETLFEGPGDYERATHTLTSRRTGERYRLGDDLSVKVRSIEWDRKQVRWELVRHEAHPDAPKRTVGEAPPQKRKRDVESAPSKGRRRKS